VLVSGFDISHKSFCDLPDGENRAKSSGREALARASSVIASWKTRVGVLIPAHTLQSRPLIWAILPCRSEAAAQRCRSALRNADHPMARGAKPAGLAAQRPGQKEGDEGRHVGDDASEPL
jgi:hypothetical protein